MEMRVYISNLGKYNEGELVGDWFTPPINPEEVAERIGLNGEYEEYAIHDYELPFDIGEFTSLNEINRLCGLIEEIEGSPIYYELKSLTEWFFSDVEELLENQDDIVVYSDCHSMEDLAQHHVEETGMIGEVPSNLQNYIDYQALGRDMEIEGSFLVTSHGVFEYIN